MPLNEADTTRVYVIARLRDAGWEQHPHSITEQHTFTDGRIKVIDGKPIRGERKRADCLLRYTGDFAIGVVEVKPEGAPQGTGLQQSKNYADILRLKFAFATDGHWIVELDYTTGTERSIPEFPTPQELFDRLKKAEHLSDETATRLLTPTSYEEGKQLRYYQEIAINRVVQAVLQGRRRVLLCMATGTGKTLVAFQVCWKLWSARWNREGAHRKPRILFLAFQRPLRTRRERAEHLRKGQPDLFDRYSVKAQTILGALLDQYTEHGPGEFKIPDALAVGPIARYGNPMEIADLFGGPLEMRQAVDRLQALLYAE